MSIKKTLINSDIPKRAYLGTDRVKFIYVDTKLIYADTLTVSIQKTEGVDSVAYTVTEKDNSTFSGIATLASESIQVGYGATVSFTPVAVESYKLGPYTESITVTSDQTCSFTAELKEYTVTISRETLGINSITYSISIPPTQGNATGTVTTTKTTIKVVHGSVITFTPNLQNYFVIDTTTYTITESIDIVLKAYQPQYSITCEISYNDKIYTNGKVGYFWLGNSGTQQTTTFTTKYTAGTSLSITCGAEYGFEFSHIIFDEENVGDPTFVTMPNKDCVLTIVYKAATHTTKFTSLYSNGTTSTNSITKTGFKVNATLYVNYGTGVSKGRTLAVVPVGYRPSDKKTFENKQTWTYSTSGAYYTNEPQIIIATNGNVTYEFNGYTMPNNSVLDLSAWWTTL